MSKEFPDLVKALPIFEGQFDAYKLESEKFDVLFSSYPAGTAIQPHEHDTENIGVVTSGRLSLTKDGRVTEVGPGEWYHLNKNQQHAAAFEVDTQLMEIWFR